MDNTATGCNGNVHSYNGYCDNDMLIRFEDKLGRNCQSRWLVNNWRWKYGRLGKNEQDAFDASMAFAWSSFSWTEANCAKGWAFDVPNKV